MKWKATRILRVTAVAFQERARKKAMGMLGNGG